MRVCPWPNKPIRRLPAEVAIRGQSRLAVNSEVLVPSTHFGMEKRVTAGYPLCAYLVEGRPAELALEEWRMDVEPFRTPHGRKVRVRVWRSAECGWAEVTLDSRSLLEAERQTLPAGYIPHSHCECCGCCTGPCYCSCCCSPC